MNTTPICIHFRKGSCRNGDRCKFSHDLSENKNRDTGSTPKRPPKPAQCNDVLSCPSEINFRMTTRIRACIHFTKGGCRNGDRCNFSHDLSENENREAGSTPSRPPQSAPCKDGLSCPREDCFFLHPSCEVAIETAQADAIDKESAKLHRMREDIQCKQDSLINVVGDAVVKLREEIRAMKSSISVTEMQLQEFKTSSRMIRKDRFGLMQLNRESRRLHSGLPFYGFRADVVSAVRDHNITIIIGETGSGKSTQVLQ